jgi:serine/threonine protein kinase
VVKVVETTSTPLCPECGRQVSSEPWARGLCPHCLIELALTEASVVAADLDDPETLPTLEYPSEKARGESPHLELTSQQILGDRYQVRSLLGRGGMGEVWRAYDLKLRVDVALKALRTELIEDTRALETLRQEVRTAREVISPNVCRVYDLEELDGQELVSMEYVDGTTLQEILRKRGPLELDEAREIATQFLAGLEAIHEASLVHRDIKPENLMITRTGRVVVMDFGIAKGLGEAKGGMVAGTPAYMSPEQARSVELDARGDLFSAGVVLAEMVEPGGLRTFEDRRRLWEGLHQESPRVSETPWSKIIAKAVAAEREERFADASALARALEEVTLRAAGDEEARPYPGLAAFQEEDARFFFGRELEVEALWKKLRRPHLLAVIGPSGAGKSSFLRAGLLPTLTDGWRAIVAKPGSRPFSNLARQLAPQLDDESEVVDRLLRFEEPEVAVELLSEWRRQEKHGLLIVDQFEELFTQNPIEVQNDFAELLGMLPLKADVHVLLSMRDDFLLHCQSFEALAPVFSEMTPLGPPTGASLRRAIVQPALKCGYRFEDESVVEEMLGEVEGERGSLPMVAFAAARLWERRDRDTGLLTREAYEQIGGVGGALAQHAEAALEKAGEDQIPVVRELFRNLVTAQGTRAARDRDELLSVFDRRGHDPSSWGHDPEFLRNSGHVPGRDRVPSPAAEILDTLIDARLLTSYEITAAEDEETSRHRIEIIHESLLTNWPRLVRWRMQDAEGAQLRDELRQAAQMWEQHDRSTDLLWTGTAFQEFQLWRDRYPGGLSAAEEAFGQAMIRHAERRRRRRRVAVAAAFVALLSVLAIVGGFWRRSVAEARRAEAAKLLALAQLRQEEDPTEALAYTTASLELADTGEARIFALRLLIEAPPALEVEGSDQGLWESSFSPDGSRLASFGISDKVRVWTAEGGSPVVLPGHEQTREGVAAHWASNELLVTGSQPVREAYVWKFPGGGRVQDIDFGSEAWWKVRDNRLFAEVIEKDAETGDRTFHLRSWPLPAGEAVELGAVDVKALGRWNWSFFDGDGSGWLYVKGEKVFRRPLPAQEGVPDQLVGSHENEIRRHFLPTEPGRLWTRDAVTSELRLWRRSRPLPSRPHRPVDPQRGAPGQPVGLRGLAGGSPPHSATKWYLFWSFVDLSPPRGLAGGVDPRLHPTDVLALAGCPAKGSRRLLQRVLSTSRLQPRRPLAGYELA